MTIQKIAKFNFLNGDIILSKYEIAERLGSGLEGEVYKIKEISTGIERAAKLFFPHRNINNKSSRFYANKLHKLRQCQILIKYHHEETLFVDGLPVRILISEYVEGDLLSEFVKTFPGKRLPPHIALHLLYALVKGIEEIHLLNEYHGDLHTDNVVVNRFGLTFDLKLLDMFHWGAPTKANLHYDIVSIIRIFHEVLGGSKHYAHLPSEIKWICCGLKQSIILKRFKHISYLKEHLDKLRLNSKQVR